MYRKSIIITAITGLVLLAGGCRDSSVKPPILSGHRGASYIAPENTLAAADSCIKYGIGFMECDICISRDSVFYLLHDSTLDRTTNGSGPLSDWMSADIDTLDAGSWFGPEFRGVRVPRLSELLKKAKQNGLNLTIDYRNGDLSKLLELIRSEGMLEHCSFTFWSEKQAREFRELAPEVKTLQAYVRSEADIDRLAAEFKPDIAVIRIEQLTPELSAKCRKNGMKILALALGPDSVEEKSLKAIQLGVDILATDRPELLVKEYGKHSSVISSQWSK